MRLPIDPRDIMNSGAKIAEERERLVRIAIFVDVAAPDTLVDIVQEAMRPLTSRARLHVEACAPGEVLIIDDAADAVIAITGPGDTLARSLAGSREKFVPTVLISVGEHADAVSRRLGHPILDTITDSEVEDITAKLGAWLADRVNAKRLALASNFALVRRAVAIEAVKATSFQNGVIGAVAVIPGADLPIMTANQAKMVLQVAAAYGVPLGTERIRELIAVVGGAFTMRAIARQFLNFVPGIGWAIKGVVGYTGTMAMGYAAIEYFEGGADLSGLGEKLKEARDKAVESAVKTRDKAVESAVKTRGRLTGAAPDDGPIPAHAYVVASTTPVGTPTAEEIAPGMEPRE